MFQSFPTGGLNPVAAFAVEINGLENLVIANSGNGLITLLGGTEGLAVEATLFPIQTGLPEPCALVLRSSALIGDELEFYATTEGVEAASLLAFILGGETPAIPPIVSGPGEGPPQLVPPNDSSLPLVSTLLVMMIETPSAESPQGRARRRGHGGHLVLAGRRSHGGPLFLDGADGPPRSELILAE